MWEEQYIDYLTILETWGFISFFISSPKPDKIAFIYYFWTQVT